MNVLVKPTTTIPVTSALLPDHLPQAFDRVRCVSSPEISAMRIFITGATVELKVMAHRRGPKIIVYKMKPKKKTRRKNGHRQELTRVMVQSITVAGKALA